VGEWLGLSLAGGCRDIVGIADGSTLETLELGIDEGAALPLGILDSVGNDEGDIDGRSEMEGHVLELGKELGIC